MIVGKIYYRLMNSYESIEIINSYKNKVYCRDIFNMNENILYVNDNISKDELAVVHNRFKTQFFIEDVNNINDEIKIKIIKYLFNIGKILVKHIGKNNV